MNERLIGMVGAPTDAAPKKKPHCNLMRGAKVWRRNVERRKAQEARDVAVLTDEQKQKADQLLGGGCGMM